MEHTSPSLPRVVIIGAGFGGLQAALHLKGAPCHITVVDKNNHHLFQPLLYQVATAGLSPGEIAAPVRHVLRDSSDTEVLMDEVIGIDATYQRVLFAKERDIPYDYLVLATGARHSYFGHDEWEPFAPGLKSISDATNIRRRILSAYERAELEEDESKRQALLTIVIVGGGPTGVEMAGSIAELAHKGMKQEFQNFNPADTRVLLAEAGPQILAAFPNSLATSAEKELQRLGVEVLTNTRVENIDGTSVMMNGNRVATHTVVWAAGVEASRAGTWLGIETDRAGRVPVDPYLQPSGHDDIYVIGDTALARSSHGEALPGLAPVAMQQGRYVARRIRASLSGKTFDKSFHYIDKGALATIGRAFAVAKIGKLGLSGVLAWLIWVFVHIMYLIGFRNRILVLTEWTWAYATYQRGVRLIVENDT